MAINEIYARHEGCLRYTIQDILMKKKAGIMVIFRQKSLVDNMLSEIGKRNIQQLAQWRDNDVSYEQVVPNQELILNDK